MISWYAETTLLRICRKSSKESSARCVARIVECNSSPSPDRNCWTEVDAAWLTDWTPSSAFAKTCWNPPDEPEGPAAPETGAGGTIGATGRIGDAITHLPEEVDRAFDHVLDRRDGGHIGFISSSGAHEIHHVFGRINAGKCHITICIGIGVAGQIPTFGVARVGDVLRDGHTLTVV